MLSIVGVSGYRGCAHLAAPGIEIEGRDQEGSGPVEVDSITD